MSYVQHTMGARRSSRDDESPYSQRAIRSAPYALQYQQGSSSYQPPLITSSVNPMVSYDMSSTTEGRYLPIYESPISGRSAAGMISSMQSSMNTRQSSMPGYLSSTQPHMAGSLIPPSNPYATPLTGPYNYPSLLPYQSYNYSPQTPDAYPYTRSMSYASQGLAIGNNVLPTNPGAPIQTTKDIQGPEGCNLFVFHIPNDMTNTDLYTLFSEYGIVISARIMVDKITGRSRGFGFVSFEKRENAEDAIAGMNGYQIGHKRLKVQHKKEKEKNDYSLPYSLHNLSSSGMPKTSTTYYHNTYLTSDAQLQGGALDDDHLADAFQNSLRIDGGRSSINADFERSLDFRDGLVETPLETGVVVNDYRSPKTPSNLLKAGSTDGTRAPIAWVGGSGSANDSSDDIHGFDVSSGPAPTLWGKQTIHN